MKGKLFEKLLLKLSILDYRATLKGVRQIRALACKLTKVVHTLADILPQYLYVFVAVRA